ncbi:hypothetical protein GCM10022237_48560 [Nocardioides ginsengisoli]|uniref:Helix-turn-helix domain-containing protein n=1 Tax=Nocardioides ginsengisoli TaxID=363868 RepID=A0ABW3W1G2_9ACTN
MTRTDAAAERAPAFVVRDARGLDVYEKAFLFVVASRGEMFSRAEVAADDMGFSVAQFHKIADRLIARGLVVRQRRPGKPSVYRLNLDALIELLPKPKQSRRLRKVSTTETPSPKVSSAETPNKVSPLETRRIQVSPTESRVSTVETPVRSRPLKTTLKKKPKSARTKIRGGYLGDRGVSTVETLPDRLHCHVDPALMFLRKNNKAAYLQHISAHLGIPSIEARDVLRHLVRIGEVDENRASGTFLANTERKRS